MQYEYFSVMVSKSLLSQKSLQWFLILFPYLLVGTPSFNRLDNIFWKVPYVAHLEMFLLLNLVTLFLYFQLAALLHFLVNNSYACFSLFQINVLTLLKEGQLLYIHKFLPFLYSLGNPFTWNTIRWLYCFNTINFTCWIWLAPKLNIID